MISLSVVLIVKNEESRLARALESVKGWADEIIVVDDESTDKTRDIAARYTDKIFVKKDNKVGLVKWEKEEGSETAQLPASNEWGLMGGKRRVIIREDMETGSASKAETP